MTTRLLTTTQSSGAILATADGNQYPVTPAGDPTGGVLAWVSVKEFGAKGDGATDDSGAFQTAINTLAGTGVTLWVPAATYKIGSPLMFPQGKSVRMRGSGFDTCKLVSTIVPGVLNTNSLFVATSTIVGSVNLSANVTRGTRTFQVASLATTGGGNLAVGSLVQLQYGPASPQALRVQTYVVKGIAGVGPFTVTVDRPILDGYTTGAGALCVLLSGRPEDIHIAGFYLSGTGWRYFEFLGAYRCSLRDCVCDESSGTLQNDYACSFDLGGYENVFERVRVTAAAPQACLVIESNEDSVVRDCYASGATTYGFLAQDSFGTLFDGCSADTVPDGIGVLTDGSNLGCQFTVVRGGKRTNCSAAGIIVAQGSLDTVIEGGVDTLCATGVNCSANGAASSRTKIVGHCCTANTLGINVDPSVTGTELAGVDLSNCTGTVNGTAMTIGNGADVVAAGLRAFGLGNYGFVVGGTLSLSDFEVQTSGAGVFLFTNTNAPGNGACTIRLANGHLQCDGNNSAGVQLAQPGAGLARLYTTQVRIDGAGAGTSGAALNSGCVGRLGLGSDFSATATPINLAGSGVANRKGTVVANGATGVAVAFPDINAQDVVLFTLRTSGGTVGHPKYTITAGTGFTFTSDAADTSTYEWYIP